MQFDNSSMTSFWNWAWKNKYIPNVYVAVITCPCFNTLRQRQDGRHFADDFFMCIFFNENCCILVKVSLKYVRNGPIDNNPALVQILAWRRAGDKPLSEPVMISLVTHICVTRRRWVKVNTCLLYSASKRYSADCKFRHNVSLTNDP